MSSSSVATIAQAVDIVMIEDDEGHARLIRKNLERAGLSNKVNHFASGTAALEFLFGEGRPDGRPLLVLLDLNLPDMRGTDILARLKEHEALRRTPVIVLTTTDDQREIQRCYDLGCNAYVTKPLSYEGFANAIRQLGLFVSVMQVPETD